MHNNDVNKNYVCQKAIFKCDNCSSKWDSSYGNLCERCVLNNPVDAKGLMNKSDLERMFVLACEPLSHHAKTCSSAPWDNEQVKTNKTRK